MVLLWWRPSLRGDMLRHAKVRHHVELRTTNGKLVLKFLAILTARSGKWIAGRSGHPTVHVILHAGVKSACILRNAVLLLALRMALRMMVHRIRVLLELKRLLHHLVWMQRGLPTRYVRRGKLLHLSIFALLDVAD